MSGRNLSGVPARWLGLEQPFVAWRKARKPGERIPHPRVGGSSPSSAIDE
jgi:hypothetical protein